MPRSRLLRDLVGDLVEQLDGPSALAPTADREELLRVLSREARAGSVTAAKALLREFDERADPAASAAAAPAGPFDELAARRKSG